MYITTTTYKDKNLLELGRRPRDGTPRTSTCRKAPSISGQPPAIHVNVQSRASGSLMLRCPWSRRKRRVECEKHAVKKTEKLGQMCVRSQVLPREGQTHKQ